MWRRVEKWQQTDQTITRKPKCGKRNHVRQRRVEEEEDDDDEYEEPYLQQQQLRGPGKAWTTIMTTTLGVCYLGFWMTKTPNFLSSWKESQPASQRVPPPPRYLRRSLARSFLLLKRRKNGGQTAGASESANANNIFDPPLFFSFFFLCFFFSTRSGWSSTYTS